MNPDEAQLRGALRSLLAEPGLAQQLTMLEPATVCGVVARLGLAEIGPGAVEEVLDRLAESPSDCRDSTQRDAAGSGIASLVAAAMAI